MSMDIKSKEKRSQNMSKIRSKNTKPELFIRSELHRIGYRFRVNSSLVEGHPDVYFTKKRIALFVHGCYWHRHKDCKYAYMPKSNEEFWTKKFLVNMRRDESVMDALTAEGIRVLVIWECTVKKMMRDEATRAAVIMSIQHFIESSNVQETEL